jgi:hypothetical protein
MGTWVVRKGKFLSSTDKTSCRDERKLQVEQLDKSHHSGASTKRWCDGQPHPPIQGVPMSDTVIAHDIQAAARRMYDAEVALHIARQTGLNHWVKAASDPPARSDRCVPARSPSIGARGLNL